MFLPPVKIVSEAIKLLPEETKERGRKALRAAAESPELKTAPEYEGKSSGWIEDFVRSSPQMGSQILATLAGGPIAGIGFMVFRLQEARMRMQSERRRSG